MGPACALTDVLAQTVRNSIFYYLATLRKTMGEVHVYARVSTDDQSLARQVHSTLGYAEDVFDVSTGPQTDEELAEYIADADPSVSPVEAGEVILHFDRSTGTDIARDGYQDLLEEVGAGAVDAVVTHSVSRISRSIRDLDATSETIVEENDTEFHIISEGFELHPERSDPFQRAMFQLLGVFAELEANLAQQRAKEGLAARMKSDDYTHGPAPLGYYKEDGYLYQATNYDQVIAVLDQVDADELSKRKAASKLDTSRRTINRSLQQRRGLYRLD